MLSTNGFENSVRIFDNAYTRRELVSDAEWYMAAHVDGRRQHGLTTFSLNVPGGAIFISLHRPWKDRAFSDQERDLLSLLNRCNAWLLRRLADDRTLAPAAPPLSPRLERMLAELQMLYRETQVSSRAELMALPLPRGSTPRGFVA